MNTLKKIKYPTINVVATAIAVYEYSGSRIVRDSFTDENGVKILSNRQLITDCLAGQKGPFLVNEIHVKQAEGIIQYLQQTVIMQSLQNKVDSFLSQMTELVTNLEVTNKDIGIIAWAPHVADQYQKKDHVREVSARYEHHSRYVGHVRDRITTNFTLIEKRYIKSMDCWAVYGADDAGNLLFYWARSLDKVCEVGKISGRIKDHKEDEYRSNARVTTLNYVKVI